MHDFLPVISFILGYIGARFTPFADQAIYVATATMMLATCLQLLWQLIKKQPIERKQYLTAALILLLGALTLILRNEMIIKLKPTIVNFALAALFAGSVWFSNTNLTQKMLQSALSLPEPLWKKLNHYWVGFFIFSGTLNAFVAYFFSETFWLGFKLWGLMGSTFVFIALHFVFLRPYFQESSHDQPHS
ncbi:MAG: septation protein IspZ [Cardiobacteriaceae bacterium]|nr:septation protein IspZ [Cardiobacteriaceae bacterium]